MVDEEKVTSVSGEQNIETCIFGYRGQKLLINAVSDNLTFGDN